MYSYQDIALPLAWPDQTARGDELWMAILKKIGIVKNLNFKVGHAAIVLIERKTGEIRYFDFGRYLTPRGFGRARSALFDPRLELHTIARFDSEGKLNNLEEILEELKSKESATHGGGMLLCSLAYGISFKKAVAFAETLVDKGPVLYGALAPSNNSCSRYVAQILCEGMPRDDKRINKILYPESLKASPTSNVVNASSDKSIIRYEENEINHWDLNRWSSLKYQIQILKANFSKSASKDLPDDGRLGHIHEPLRPAHIPKEAQWLGGLGEGAWYYLGKTGMTFEVYKFDYLGNLEYQVQALPDQMFSYDLPYQFTFDIHNNKHVLKQSNQQIIFKSLNMAEDAIKKSI